MGPLSDDLEFAWTSVRGTILNVAMDMLALRRFQKRPWLLEKSLDILNAKKEARLQTNQHEYRRLKVTFKVMTKDDLENFHNVLADEAEEAVTRNNLRPTYRTISECVSVRLNNAPIVPSPYQTSLRAHQSTRH